MARQRCYASHSIDAGNMLAVWLGSPPACSKEQRDPDGWAKGVARTDFLAKRLAELAKAPEVEIVWLHGGGRGVVVPDRMRSPSRRITRAQRATQGRPVAHSDRPEHRGRRARGWQPPSMGKGALT